MPTIETDKLQVISNVLNGDFSMDDFMKDQYENYLNKYDFEDKVLLEYCLMYERRIKEASQ